MEKQIAIARTVVVAVLLSVGCSSLFAQQAQSLEIEPRTSATDEHSKFSESNRSAEPEINSGPEEPEIVASKLDLWNRIKVAVTQLSFDREKADRVRIMYLYTLDKPQKIEKVPDDSILLKETSPDNFIVIRCSLNLKKKEDVQEQRALPTENNDATKTYLATKEKLQVQGLDPESSVVFFDYPRDFNTSQVPQK